MGIPDLRFINRNIPIIDAAQALGLTVGASGNLHCWRPDLHQNGDRTASVGVRKTNNTVKCFGCGIGPLGVVDLVMAVIGTTNPGEAARWIAERFPVPEVPTGKHLLRPERPIFQYGFETDIGLLVFSGIWAQLSPAARAITPVLLERAVRDNEQKLKVQISYRTLGRFSGISSPNAIAAALRELKEIHWLWIIAGCRESNLAPVRRTSTYLLTPRSDEFMELANANSAQLGYEIQAERKLRSEARTQRTRMFTK